MRFRISGLPAARFAPLFALGDDELLAQGATVAAYQQDYTGARVAKLAGGVSTQYHYDRAGHLLAESDGTTGAAGTEYLWLDDLPVAMVENGALYYIHTDHLGTPERVTDANQNVVWDAVLRPFGLPEQVTLTFTQNLRFPGQYADAETGLSYNFFRDYDPSIGRYIESDPIGLAGGVNTYAYVGENPISRTDTQGKFWPEIVGLGIIGALIFEQYEYYRHLPVPPVSSPPPPPPAQPKSCSIDNPYGIPPGPEFHNFTPRASPVSPQLEEPPEPPEWPGD